MQRKVYIALFSLVAVAAMTVGYFGFASADNDNDKRMIEYEVTVTNITRGAGTSSGQILGGLVVATHNSDFDLFTLGQAASEELAALAEDAHTDPLVNALSGNTNVKDIQLIDPPGPIMPGQSASVTITADRQHKYLSLATMLVTTNDGFAALNGVPLPSRSGEFFAVGYDAGSEANTENCTDIPGPPCGNPDVRVIAGAEGYVSVHSGIHGIASLQPEERDWRNPVAWVTIKRVSKDRD